MKLSRSELLKNYQKFGISRADALRIADNWFGSPAPSPLKEKMSWTSLFVDTDDRDACQFRDINTLLILGQTKPRQKLGNRVTDFSGWVFDLCFPARRRRTAALEMGKKTERKLLERHRARYFLRLPEPSPQSREWELIFRDPLTDVDPFRISSLKVNGRAMYGVPDIVYKNKNTGEIMIVEIKATDANLPQDGWPNLRTQLWCYAKIDRWADAPKIRLVGQVWSPGGTTLRRTFNWCSDSEKFNQECTRLFECYQEKAISLPYNLCG